MKINIQGQKKSYSDTVAAVAGAAAGAAARAAAGAAAGAAADAAASAAAPVLKCSAPYDGNNSYIPQ